MAKYSSLTRGQDEALVNLLGKAYGGDGMAAVMAILGGAPCDFGRRAYLADAGVRYSGGLSVLG